jgi:hypothetical protein
VGGPEEWTWNSSASVTLKVGDQAISRSKAACKRCLSFVGKRVYHLRFGQSGDLPQSNCAVLPLWIRDAVPWRGRAALDLPVTWDRVRKTRKPGGCGLFFVRILSHVQKIAREGRTSLKIFLEACAEDGVEPRKQFFGRFTLKGDPSIHQAAAIAAVAHGKRLNQWAEDVLRQAALA